MKKMNQMLTLVIFLLKELLFSVFFMFFKFLKLRHIFKTVLLHT